MDKLIENTVSLVTGMAGNYMLICAMMGWFGASMIKIAICLARDKRLDFRKLFASGGMPSSHSATVTALCTAAAKSQGLRTPEFAISFIFAYIVMHDAAGVRRAAGEQAKTLNSLVNSLFEHKPLYLNKKLKELIGHTPLEVVVGGLLGVLISLLFPVY